jgi:hypothetical protein
VRRKDIEYFRYLEETISQNEKKRLKFEAMTMVT